MPICSICNLSNEALQAFTNCAGVRRHGYAANFVAITMSLVCLPGNSLMNFPRSFSLWPFNLPVP
uniref:Uncharacterized protein MANES_01G038700 n=1 Tax=Rhizophora mucronata TaxID=61149 RepID=A0A2P2K7K6_RHIMU